MRWLLLSIVLLNLSIPAVAEELFKPCLVDNPAQYMAREAGGMADDRISGFQRDFDGDGRPDWALSFARDFGKSGRAWQIFLSRNDGRYTAIGNLFFYDNFYTIEPVSKGYSSVLTAQKGSQGNWAIIESSLSRRGIREVKSIGFNLRDGTDLRPRLMGTLPPLRYKVFDQADLEARF